MDLAQERGGTLLIASLVEGRIVVTARSYHTCDDDSLILSWYDGALVTTTQTDGQLRLVEMGADKAAPGTFEQESLACRSKADGGTEHSIRLAIDTDGRVTAAGLSVRDSRTDAGRPRILTTSTPGSSFWHAGAHSAVTPATR